MTSVPPNNSTANINVDQSLDRNVHSSEVTNVNGSLETDTVEHSLGNSTPSGTVVNELLQASCSGQSGTKSDNYTHNEGIVRPIALGVEPKMKAEILG